ncbi:beta-aspartyl-peptidase [Filobacillus milosensis]|uniref:Isoaspartyl dipeptidase n=1 Tax=Filobacillus milosensis TaxID=94137 RepID=A0A4Y8IIF2_9BACI|nr:beta-aspartyl-peptidase [Filobacillus milosensis]TFB19598.1 beta-aspartyl-peptidase [Filobacillus milosensis]
MIKIIKNANVYAPHPLGMKDVLIANDKIAKIDDVIEVPNWAEAIDASGKIMTPGFIDGHVHITGGGGEGSFHTRTPELNLTDATMSGVTTVVGVIGTDGTTRTMTNLVAKAKALCEEGITCYALTGNYHVPVRTLTGKVEDDIMLIDVIIGAGEIAIADHRSSQPTVDELAKIGSQARIGGMLSGKKGIVNVHVGGGHDRLQLLESVVEQTNLPIEQFQPTHINRNEALFNHGVSYAKKGGLVDFTTSTIPNTPNDPTIPSSRALKRMMNEGVPVENMTFTSDAQGSLPEFNEKGELVGLQVGKIRSLYEAFVESVKGEGIDLEQALQVVTKNPASILGLKQKGQIQEGLDADLVLLDQETLDIDTVMARGQVMVQHNVAVVKGTFEE